MLAHTPGDRGLHRQEIKMQEIGRSRYQDLAGAWEGRTHDRLKRSLHFLTKNKSKANGCLR
ncbi:hypothetical protein E2562_027877 [Oryza meyeriana var. granulata]|uniref:Uncharacterized protein n=1 Tax=Oryza meyeriana var. granulata TaxID=110450 RepID=A0A6G1CTG5_9ORYZ|nr:hypothetical protein E2562_027877 [Oryza meyeriana var. granulata]